jgi:type IV pilus assembly protein PilC
MIFKYKVITTEGRSQEGTIDAPNKDGAISSLQRRGFILVSIEEEKGGDVFATIGVTSPFDKVKDKDVVILSRQIATLFDAGVSALKAFRILSTESESKALRKYLTTIADDIQSGTSISNALAKQDKVFSPFYVNMVRAGEESGKLNQTFVYLADYLDRNYELTSKTKNALIYPAFVIGTFVIVMILMLTMVIPKLSVIIKESGQEIPVYTQAVMWFSDLLVNYGFFVLIFLVAFGAYFFYFKNNAANSDYFDELKLQIPYISDLYQKLYYSRICDNLDTMLSSGVSIVRALDITAKVVDNKIYQRVIEEITEDVKSGSGLSEAMRRHKEMPNIMVQMVTIGEETGKLGDILKNLAFFYKREVNGAVETLVSLIEPVMIVALGLGVGILLASVLIPIYNVAGSI